MTVIEQNRLEHTLEYRCRYVLLSHLAEDKRVLDFSDDARSVLSLSEAGAKEITTVSLIPDTLAQDLKGLGLSQVKIISQSEFPLPFADSSFDLVISDPHEKWLSDIDRWQPELRRVLSDDGYLVLSLANREGQFLSDLRHQHYSSDYSYEDIFEKLSDQFGILTLFGQSPLLANLFFDFESEEEEPDLLFDRSLLGDDSEEAGWFILIFGPKALHREDLVIVQVPLPEVLSQWEQPTNLKQQSSPTVATDDKAQIRLQQENVALTQKVQELESEHQETQALLQEREQTVAQSRDQQQNAHSVIQQQETLIQRLTKRQQEIENHLLCIQQNQDEQNQCQEFQNERDRLQQEKDALETEKQQLESTSEQFEHQAQEMQNTVHQMQAEAETRTLEMQGLQEKLQQAESLVVEREQQNQDEQNQCQEFQNERDRLQQEKDALEKEKQQLESASEQLEHQAQEMQNTVHQMRTEAETRTLEIRQLQEKLIQVSNQYKEKVTHCEGEQNSSQMLREELKRLQAEKEDLLQEIESNKVLLEQFNAQQNEHNTILEKMRCEGEARIQEIQQLEEKIKTAEEQSQQSEKQSWKNEQNMLALQESLSEKEKLLTEIEQRHGLNLEQIKHEHDEICQRLQKQLDQQQTDLDQQRQSYDTFQGEKSDLEAEIERQQKDKKSLEIQIKDLLDEVGQLRAGDDNVTDELANTRSALDALEKVHAQLNEQHRSILQERDDLRTNFQQEKMRFDSMKEEINRLNKQLTELELSKQDLEQEIQTKQSSTTEPTSIKEEDDTEISSTHPDEMQAKINMNPPSKLESKLVELDSNSSEPLIPNALSTTENVDGASNNDNNAESGSPETLTTSSPSSHSKDAVGRPIETSLEEIEDLIADAVASTKNNKN